MKNKKLAKVIISAVLSFSIVFSNLGYFSVLAVEPDILKESKEEKSILGTEISDLLKEMYANIPNGQEKVTYQENYESSNPEMYTQIKGTVDSKVGTGANTISLGADSYATLNNSPWLSSGYINIDFKHNYQASGGYLQSGVTFLTKADDKGYMEIRYDAEKGLGSTTSPAANMIDWVVQGPDDKSPYKKINGFDKPKLEKDKEYNIKIAFHEDHLILALDDEVFFDEKLPLFNEGEFNNKLGQFGFGKRFGAVDITVLDLAIEGVGTKDKPPTPVIRYEKDYEDSNKGQWSTPDIASIIDDGTGQNNVLELTAVNEGRFVDLDSPDIESGSLSFDFKVIEEANGFAFGYRMLDNATKYSELGYVPGSKTWIPETTGSWGQDIGMEPPVIGKWNNIIINFEGDMYRIYLNNMLVGEYTFKFDKVPGKLGFRLRKSGVSSKIQIDNLVYTTEMLSPKPVMEYYNDYDEGVSGVWDNNAVSSVISEGSNNILKLNTKSTTSLLSTGLDIEKGSLSAKVKSPTNIIKIALGSNRANDDFYYLGNDGNQWYYETAIKGTSTRYNLTGKASNIMELKWHDIGINFDDSSIKLYVDGNESELKLSVNNKILGGTLGFESTQDIYIDNLHYTENIIDFSNSTSNTNKFYYEEYYDTPYLLNFTGLTSSSQSDGRVKGSIAANTSAINKDINTFTHGVYQLKIKSSQDKTGVSIGNMQIYLKDTDTWVYKIENGAENIIGKFDEVKSQEDFVIRVQIIKDEVSLWINNKSVGRTNVLGYVAGEFGVYNPDNNSANVEIDAMGAEEIIIYSQDFSDANYTPNWSVLGSNPGNTIKTTINNESLDVELKSVIRAIDDNTPSLLNQKMSVDFTPNVDDSLIGGGRYGVVLRGSTDAEYVSVEVDINGIWRVFSKGNEYKFSNTYSMTKDEKHKIEVTIVGSNVSLDITDSSNNKVSLGTVSVDNITTTPGKFGLKSWFGSKIINIDNIDIEEIAKLPLFYLRTKEAKITKDKFTVTIDAEFPRVISYTLDGKTINTNSAISTNLYINGKAYVPNNIITTNNVDSYIYEMQFDDLDLVITGKFIAKENGVLRFDITKVEEKGEFLVRTISLGESNLGYSDSIQKDSSYAWTKSNGEWHGLSEEIIENLKDVTKTGKLGSTMAMVSGDDLAISIENNVMSGGNKVLVSITKGVQKNSIAVYNGVWTYRHQLNPKSKSEQLPWMEIVVTGDQNSDKRVDWQDAAVAYRKYILIKPFEAEDMANSMMYIPFNFASQATDNFLNTLDTGKVLYNYSDGFGQMLLHKGYQDEGHDSAIPSYSDIGVRQGGIDDLKYLISKGDKYNVKVGVHINATEYHLDANELYYQNLQGSTPMGPFNIPTGSVREKGFDTLQPGWDWVDTTFYVDQTKDVLTNQLEKRFTELANLTKNDDGTGLDFYYIDVYTGNDYNAYKLIEQVNGLGIKVGTEFAGPLEPGSNFVHWGPDLGYPNKGNSSKLYRMVKNDQDIFVGNALFKGQKIAVVSTWGDSKPDIWQGITVFFNEVLPTKYMQHHGVLKMEEDKITFEDNLTSSRNKSTGMVELKKDNKIISTWKDTGTTTNEGERHSGEATSLIPWEWDIKTNSKLDVSSGAKLYHWNTTDSSVEFELTDLFKTVNSFDLYELTQQGKVFKQKIDNNNGTITINSSKNTPYVLYPEGVNAEDIVPAAKDWGEGSIVKDFAFNSEKLNIPGSFQSTDNNANIKVVPDERIYDITKEMKASLLNRYLEIPSTGDTVYQDIMGLQQGKGYNLSVWTKTPQGRKSSIQVDIDGKVYTNYVSGIDGKHTSNFKYRNETWQKLEIDFLATSDKARISLIAEPGIDVVMYDDIKLWEHITQEDWSKNDKYVAFEDFENVSQGYGIFEYGDGSLKNQLKSIKDNDIVAPDGNKMGPLFTWVLGDNTSLKLGENDVGRLIKTNESGMKLEPNTKYRMKFKYTLEKNGIYEVILKSRSTGNTILQEELAANPTKGNKSNAIEKEYIFTTGTENDYQAIFRLKSVVKEGDKTETYAFILDDFTVESLNTVISSVVITTTDKTIKKGETKKFSANVIGKPEPVSQEVIWSIESPIMRANSAIISNDGILTVDKDSELTQLNIKATSVVDNTKFDTAVITVTSDSVTPPPVLRPGNSASSGTGPMVNITVPEIKGDNTGLIFGNTEIFIISSNGETKTNGNLLSSGDKYGIIFRPKSGYYIDTFTINGKLFRLNKKGMNVNVLSSKSHDNKSDIATELMVTQINEEEEFFVDGTKAIAKLMDDGAIQVILDNLSIDIKSDVAFKKIPEKVIEPKPTSNPQTGDSNSGTLMVVLVLLLSASLLYRFSRIYTFE